MTVEARRLGRCLVVSSLLLGLPGWTSAQSPSTPAGLNDRPKIGLVLSGGGARGLAHVGVLKVLEQERIPVDMIAGTSMGAIIGGLYASGMTANDLERELLLVAWDRVFASRVAREQLSQRRKEEDFEFSPLVELGMRNGEFRAPQGTLSSRGLEILLRRFTLPVRNIEQFDALPTPFRAIATDMESGAQVILSSGELSLAMRSSMSVPGVFAPTELSAPTPAGSLPAPRGGAADLGGGPAGGGMSRILGDGGLVNNLPLDVARSMGAQQLIAVNVGTPLSGRAALSSLIGVTGQMINILTEQNVQRSLLTLGPKDLLINPALGELSSGDFERTKALITAGEQAAESMLPQLRRFAISAEAYAAWTLSRTQRSATIARLAAITFEGSEITKPERMKAQLESKPGQIFDAERAERDARLLASSGDYERVDYHVEQRTVGDTLVFAMEDKTWGPNYFRIGLDLSTDFSGESAFNLRVSHNRHWLTDSGTEWRNQINIGQTPRLFTEIYQPLSFQLGRSTDWFVAASAELERRTINLFDIDSGRALAKLQRDSSTLAADLGQPWGRLGEIRLGLVQQDWRITPKLITQQLVTNDGRLDQNWHETGLRLKAVVDQIDFANFPQRGYRVLMEAAGGQQSGGTTVRRASFTRFELQATAVRSWGVHTLNLNARALTARQPEDSAQGPYTLGGFQQLSGYQPGQLTGNTLLFGRTTYYQRLRDTPVLTRGFFVGGSLEAGNAWARRDQVSLRDLRLAASVFVGADTGIGPLYVALGRAPRGGSAVYLFIGRPQ